MKLSADEARVRLEAADHGVLCTVHPDRGVDAVPVVYAVTDDGHVGVPVDRVKPKSSGLLQRERNLAADPRATLLVQHWDAADWSGLWWVRAELSWLSDPEDGRRAELGRLLVERYPQYAAQPEGAPFARILVLRLVGLTGWSGRTG